MAFAAFAFEGVEGWEEVFVAYLFYMTLGISLGAMSMTSV